MAQINKPTDYFNTVLYTSTSANQSVTGVGFEPDWCWIKDRTSANSHHLFDQVRGAGERLMSDQTTAESTVTSFSSFDADGFTLGSQGQGITTNNNNYASWNWLANGVGVSNTDGSITSTVSASTVSGFSIVSYTGTGANATVGHSLGSVAKMIMVKRRDTTGRWQVYHNGLGATKYLFLDGDEAEQTNSNRWNDTNPTSSVFNLGSSAEVNASGGTYIAYCFAEKKGFSKFGSYTGNGSTDGTFVYTGFKPAWVMVKRTNSTGGWLMVDNKRDPFNVVYKNVQADSSGAEYSGVDRMDFLANGFKHRYTSTVQNGSGDSYIYMCFAENPLVSSAGVPCTAR